MNSKKVLLSISIILILLFGCVAEAKATAKSAIGKGKEALDAVTKPPAKEEANVTSAPPVKPPSVQVNDTKPPEQPPAVTSSENITTEINPVSIPPEIEKNCVGFVIGAPEEMRNIYLIGGGWARPHPGPFSWGYIETSKGIYDFSTTDRWVEEAQSKNISLLATVWPYADWDQSMCHGKECAVSESDTFFPKGVPEDKEFSIPSSRCTPCDMAGYKRFLAKLVERYDGDGADDMPGLLIPVRYYEIINEPEMNSSLLTFFRGGPRQYAEVLRESYLTINVTCPECSVLHGGISNTLKATDQYWIQVFIAASGGAYFDVSNIHFIGIGDEQSLNVKHLSALLRDRSISRPVWVTEAQFSGQLANPKASLIGAQGQGAKKVFYTSFIVGKQGPPVIGEYSPVYAELPGLCGK